MTTTANWHRFDENEVGDDECGRCGVQVTVDAHMTFTAPCPLPPCPSPKNPDTGCLFSTRPSKPAACLYCGATADGEADVDELPEAERPTLAALADQLLAGTA